MNRIIILGNVSREPEVRTTQGGIKTANFGIAVNRRYANQQGVHEADFFNVIAWREKAEFIEKYVTKGKKVCIVGSLQNRSYDTQDGQKRTVTEIVIDEIEFAGKKDEGRVEQKEQKPEQMTEANDEQLPF